ncbi:hypothetical protein U1E44_06710 [Arenibacter sp. GZD96]|nr:hypothetical protein [Arenibacter sp. GZD-96]MEA1785775.1 hypothetical protein [Arenibacter sp. GZD-96]
MALFVLPSYSPEKNPHEYLNCALKQSLSAKKSAKSKDTLQDNVQNHIVMLQNNPKRDTNYFKHKDI